MLESESPGPTGVISLLILEQRPREVSSESPSARPQRRREGGATPEEKERGDGQTFGYTGDPI